MKKQLLFVTAILSLTLTSCFELVEEIWINADGSGKYEYTMDLSQVMQDDFMGGIMAQSIAEQMGQEELEIDSVLNFASLEDLPASLSSRQQQLLAQLTMKMDMSQSRKTGKILISFPFKTLSELDEINQLYQTLTEEGVNLGGAGMSPVRSMFSLQRKKFSRTSSVENVLADMDEEGLEMAKMMMADATIKSVYHLPGKVRKTTMAAAEIEQSTVTVTHKLLDVLDGKANFDGEITFK